MHVKLPLIFWGRVYIKECISQSVSPLTHKREEESKVTCFSLIATASLWLPSGGEWAESGKGLVAPTSHFQRCLGIWDLAVFSPHPTGLPPQLGSHRQFTGSPFHPGASHPQGRV